MPSIHSLNFQEACSPLMEELTFFHDHTLKFLVFITFIILYNLLSIMKSTNLNKIMHESQPLELLWTIAPTFILIIIGGPSIRLLYLLDEVFTPSLTFKILGHQWYWSNKLSNFEKVEFDSFMLPYSPSSQMFRLLDVDNRITLPFNTQIRSIVSATDVLHSWTIPSLGIKTDAIPGRLNQLNFSINRSGLFFGQCSEICGANHSFMPIVIESINLNTFINSLQPTFK